MQRERGSLRVLLLQIRDGQQVRREELESFAHYSGLSLRQIDVLNVFDQPDVPLNAADGYDALWVGGASEANVLEPQAYPFVTSCISLLNVCLERNLPVFASCFGFQLAVLALGGVIRHKEVDFEMGTLPISLSLAAAEDPLFSHLNDPFYAVSVHKQFADQVPDCCQVLAYTRQCVHAFRVWQKPFWAFQFHPEVDRRVLVERLTYYQQKYTAGEGHLQSVLDAAVETPQSNGLLSRFVDQVLLI
ncbi:type 1 glutamine amidotransferase [Pontibacter sp. JAM-7]|uniref:type 1 glutamine amidotransferase n=1 Tax=Pontibacter sp. JAM-7 TaxID=3366581 RepID=UPI003AF69AEE